MGLICGTCKEGLIDVVIPFWKKSGIETDISAYACILRNGVEILPLREGDTIFAAVHERGQTGIINRRCRA